MNKERNKNLKSGFTLLELLVVVLIIGILAAIALPQYKKVVEKSRMQEAIMNLKTIAEANERFYLLNDRYANNLEMDKLDIEIPGEIKDHSQTGLWGNRVVTKYFIYAPGTDVSKAIAHRLKEGSLNHSYYLYIRKTDNKLICEGTQTPTQAALCTKISQDGHL